MNQYTIEQIESMMNEARAQSDHESANAWRVALELCKERDHLRFKLNECKNVFADIKDLDL